MTITTTTRTLLALAAMLGACGPLPGDSTSAADDTTPTGTGYQDTDGTGTDTDQGTGQPDSVGASETGASTSGQGSTGQPDTTSQEATQEATGGDGTGGGEGTTDGASSSSSASSSSTGDEGTGGEACEGAPCDPVALPCGADMLCVPFTGAALCHAICEPGDPDACGGDPSRCVHLAPPLFLCAAPTVPTC